MKQKKKRKNDRTVCGLEVAARLRELAAVGIEIHVADGCEKAKGRAARVDNVDELGVARVETIIGIHDSGCRLEERASRIQAFGLQKYLS